MYLNMYLNAYVCVYGYEPLNKCICKFKLHMYMCTVCAGSRASIFPMP